MALRGAARRLALRSDAGGAPVHHLAAAQLDGGADVHGLAQAMGDGRLEDAAVAGPEQGRVVTPATDDDGRLELVGFRLVAQGSLSKAGLGWGLASFRQMGDSTESPAHWLAVGHRVALAQPEREEFVARWDLYNDAQLGMLATFQTAGTAVIAKPPVTREHREAVWDALAEGAIMAYDLRDVADDRFVGEVGLSRVAWPDGSGDIGVLVFDPDDRGRGYGTEAVLLVAAYAFDALRLHRLTIRYLAANQAVAQAVERSAGAAGARLVGIERDAEWAFGGYRDRLVIEVTRDNFPPHPATARFRDPVAGS